MDSKHKLFLFFLTLPFSVNVKALSHCDPWVAKIVSVQGKVAVQSFDTEDWQTIQNGDTLCSGDKIHTSKWARSTLKLHNESLLTLDQNTTLIVTGPKAKKSNWFMQILNGGTFFRSRKPQQLNIETPFINAVHEGTEFLVRVTPDNSAISVFDGTVAAQNARGRIQINKGSMGSAGKDQAPVLQALRLSPEDAVQWTLYYPPIIDIQARSKSSSSALSAAFTAYQQGDTGEALTKLTDVPLAAQDAQFLNFQAALLLSVGRVEEANQVITQLQQSNSDPSSASAFQAIIEVSKNHQQNALKLAQHAVNLNPKSAVAQVALSYAYQSLLNIDQALAAILKATELSPDNALAWARLAELQLSTGDPTAALASAQKAQNLNPHLAQTQIMRGFAALAKNDTPAAQKAFAEAITLNASEPIARLGSGLTLISDGKLTEGTRELEIAVNLDPNNAMIRSYLGKAYYELKNQDYAGKEFEIAEEMDAKDPTPWFYDAILKQTINRPIEALHAMQNAIKLNDNRGVYRSSLLLDKDLAARSASLGRIFNDLSFQRLGLIEGWKSINSDPTNHSAHRLLADNYASLPRHEVARVSELLQAQLWQPVNITPIQPQLVESRLGILDGAGPSTLSTSEYNPLFQHDRVSLQTNQVFGSHDTYGDDVVVSGLLDRASFSFGQFHYKSDGYRPNNDQQQDAYNAFIQLALFENTQAQFEYRHTDLKNGDISLLFDRKNFSETLRQVQRTNTYRLGAHHRFSPNSDLILSALHSDFTKKSDDSLVDSADKYNGYVLEAQHVFQMHQMKFISGAGVFNQQKKVTNTFDFSPLPCQFPWLAPSCIDRQPALNTTHNNGYVYSYYTPLASLDFTLGLSINSLDNEFGQRDQLNPKMGVRWQFNDKLTLRGAAFRVLTRDLLGDQTIEPTQIAGFNQFFNDLQTTDSWRYGLAADYKWLPNVYSGIEVSLRDQKVAYLQADESGLSAHSAPWSDSIVRSYFNWTPKTWLALGVDYQYERLAQNEALNTGTLTLKTHRLPLSLSLFHPIGTFLKLEGTYYHQTGLFMDNTISDAEKYSGNSQFWLANMTMGYRLPKRYGKLNFAILNLFDQDFKFQDTNTANPLITPDRSIYGSITISF